MASLADVSKKVIRTLFPAYKLNPYYGVMERNDQGKLVHTAVKRESWFKKTQKTFNVFYGSTPIKRSILRARNYGLLQRRDRNRSIFEVHFRNPFYTLRNIHIGYADRNEKAGKLGLAFSPIDGAQSVLYMALNLVLQLVTLPFKGLHLGVDYLCKQTSNKLLRFLLRSLDVLLGAGPIWLIDAVLKGINIGIAVVKEALKVTLASALTVASLPIMTVVHIVSAIKARPLFQQAGDVKLTRIHENFGTGPNLIANQTEIERNNNMKSILSVMKREKYAKTYNAKATDTEIVIGLPQSVYDNNWDTTQSVGEEWSINIADMRSNPAKLNALKELGMFGLQSKGIIVNGSYQNLDLWYKNNGINLKPADSKSTADQDLPTTPLMSGLTSM